MFGCDGRVSASIRNARSRISGEYFLFIEFHPCLKNGTKVRPIHSIRTETLVQSDSPSENSRVAIFVTLSPHADHVAFQKLIEHGPSFDIAITLSAGDGHIDSSAAGSLSKALISKVREVASTFGRSEVHFAYHGPYGLGVLLGRHLNTLRTVVYEWNGDPSSEMKYVPVMTLEPGVGGGPIVEVHLND